MTVNEEMRGEVVGEETLWCTVRVAFAAVAAAADLLPPAAPSDPETASAFVSDFASVASPPSAAAAAKRSLDICNRCV